MAGRTEGGTGGAAKEAADAVDEVLEASIREANEGINNRADARLKPDLEDGIKVKGEKDLKPDLKNGGVKKTAKRVAENEKIAAKNAELRRRAQADIDRTNRNINSQRATDVARSEKSLRTTAKNTGGAGRSPTGKDIPTRTGAQRKAANNWVKWKQQSNPRSKVIAEDYYKKGNPGFKKPKSKAKAKSKSKYSVPKKDWYFDKANAIDDVKTWDGYGKARMEQASLASQGKPARHVNPPTEAIAGTRPTKGFGSAKYSYNPKAVPKATAAGKALSGAKWAGTKIGAAANALAANPIVNNPVTRLGAKAGGIPLWLGGEAYDAAVSPTRAEFNKKGNTFQENFDKNGGIPAAFQYVGDSLDSAFDFNPHLGKGEGFWNKLLGANLIDLDENARSRIQDAYVAGSNALRETGAPEVTASDIYAPKGAVDISKQLADPAAAPGPDVNRGAAEADAFTNAPKEEQDAYLEAHGTGDAAGAAELMASMRERYDAHREQLGADRAENAAAGLPGGITPGREAPAAPAQNIGVNHLNIPDDIYGSRPGSREAAALNLADYQIENDPKKRAAAYTKSKRFPNGMEGSNQENIPLGSMIGKSVDAPMALADFYTRSNWHDKEGDENNFNSPHVDYPPNMVEQAAVASPMQYGDSKFGEALPMQPLPGERLNAAFDATNPQGGPRVNPLMDAFYGASRDDAQRRAGPGVLPNELASFYKPPNPQMSPVETQMQQQIAAAIQRGQPQIDGRSSMTDPAVSPTRVHPAPGTTPRPTGGAGGKPSKPSSHGVRAEQLVAAQHEEAAKIQAMTQARDAYYESQLNPLGQGSGYEEFYRQPNQAFINRQR